MNKIYVTEAIFSDGLPKGFTPTQYRINVNEPTMNVLYRKFREHNGYPVNEPLSDRERWAFERLIFSLIEKGRIIVRK